MEPPVLGSPCVAAYEIMRELLLKIRKPAIGFAVFISMNMLLTERYAMLVEINIGAVLKMPLLAAECYGNGAQTPRS